MLKSDLPEWMVRVLEQDAKNKGMTFDALLQDLLKTYALAVLRIETGKMEEDIVANFGETDGQRFVEFLNTLIE